MLLAYYQEVVLYLAKFGLERGDLKDAIDETFTTAFEKVGSLRDEALARNWLIKIAKSVGLKYKKKYKRETPITFIEEVKDFGGNEVWEEDVADQVIREADRELLIKCLAQLNEREYRIIMLQYNYDEKLKDIAQITGENLNTVKSISRRAKQKLKDLLMEGGYTHGK